MSYVLSSFIKDIFLKFLRTRANYINSRLLISRYIIVAIACIGYNNADFISYKVLK